VSRDTSGWTDTKRNEEKYLFMIKKYIMKNEKNKSKELEIGNDVPSKFSIYVLFHINPTLLFCQQR